MVRIDDVRIRLYRAPLEKPIKMSLFDLHNRHMALVEVVASDGSIGYGESWVNHPVWAIGERRSAVREGVKPLLVGQKLDDVDRLARCLSEGMKHSARQSGALGPMWQAISGVEIALWDLLGKVREVSTASLLGGRVRDAVPIYASGLDSSTVETLGQQCVHEGITAIKCRVGFGTSTDLETLRRARSLLGADGELYADANQGWTLEEAVSFLNESSEVGLAWIEEPIDNSLEADLTYLFQQTGIPIAIGENLCGHEGFRRLFHLPAVRVIQPDVSKSGGISHAASLCQLAVNNERQIVPHWYNGAIALAATLQVAAAFPTVTRIEYDVRVNPFRDSILKERLRVNDGMLNIPDGPGLGVDLDTSAVEVYEIKG